MAFMLITGKPGSFKTAYAMDYMLKQKATGRPCFVCNVRGLKDGSFKTLEKFEDWVDCPDGSVILIDEIQEFTRSVATNAKTEELPKHFTALEKHRHRGIDIIVTTQHPVFVHTHIRRLVEQHIHFVRRRGLPFSVKKEWPETVSDPENSKNNSPSTGVIKTTYKPNKAVFDIYESTVLDSHKFKMDKDLLKKLSPLLLIVIAVPLCIGAYKMLKSYEDGTRFTDSTSSPVASSAPAAPASSAPAAPAAVPLPSTEEDFKCAEKWGLSIEMCTELRIKGVPLYDPNDPYSYNPIPQAKPAHFPQVSGCIKWDGAYYAVSQQGTRMPDVPQAVCKRWLDDGIKPFNYFATNTRQLPINENDDS